MTRLGPKGQCRTRALAIQALGRIGGEQATMYAKEVLANPESTDVDRVHARFALR